MRSILKPLFLAAVSMSFFSCRPATPTMDGQPPIKAAKAIGLDDFEISDPSIAAIPSPTTPARSPQIARRTINGIEFEGCAFDSRTHTLSIIDQKNGPGSLFSSSRDVATKTGALLAINAGFFTPEGSPLGLVISRGKTTGVWNSASSLGSGIYQIDPSQRASITRRKTRSEVSDSRELLQAGPLLVENGRPVAGLESSKSALRSIILTDGGTRWWIGKTSTCDLASLGKTLSRSSPSDWDIQNALNLDGGRSSDLFISGKIPGGPVESRGFLNRPVRNFLVLKAR